MSSAISALARGSGPRRVTRESVVASFIPPERSTIEARAVRPSSQGAAKTKWSLAETAAKPSEAAGKGLSVNVASLFGEDSYEVKPGQHVMFEHADLHEVVDNESSPCGCPAEPSTEVAGGSEFGLGGAKDPHPFPVAVSQGLAPAPPVPQAPEGVVHAQVSTTLSYSGDTGAGTAAGTIEPPIPFDGIQQAPAPPPQKPGFLHRIGRFFKRIF